MQSEKRIDA